MNPASAENHPVRSVIAASKYLSTMSTWAQSIAPLVLSRVFPHLRPTGGWDDDHHSINNLKVKEFAKEYRAPEDQKAQCIINFDMQGQVFHFGKSRPSKQTDKIGLEKCKTVFDCIEKAFAEFMAANWTDPSLKAKFDQERADPTNVEQLIDRKEFYVYVDGPPAASSGGVQIARSTHEGLHRAGSSGAEERLEICAAIGRPSFATRLSFRGALRPFRPSLGLKHLFPFRIFIFRNAQKTRSQWLGAERHPPCRL